MQRCGRNSMSDWIKRNLSCFDCGSSDALQESTHHYKCFSCGKSFKKRDRGEAVMIESSKNDKPSSDVIFPGKSYEIKTRRISLETAEKYKITSLKYTGYVSKQSVTDEWCFCFNNYVNGVLTTQKLRSVNNKKLQRVFGDQKEDKTLYGQWLFQPNPQRFVVITEGEFDAAVVHQEGGFAAVSVRNGAEGAVRNIKENMDWLSKWGYVILAFDNDAPGQKAVQACLAEPNLFEPGKLKIVHWPLKDANDMLLADRGHEIKRLVWDAEEWRPNDLLKISDYIEEALEKPKQGMDTPWPDLTNAILGWRPGTLNIIAGAAQIGKTEVVTEIIYDLMTKKVPVWLYSSEQILSETPQRLASKAMQVPLYLPNTKWEKDKIREKMMEFDKYFVRWYPKVAITAELILSRMKYSYLADKAKVFVVDNLKAIEGQLDDVYGKGMNKLMTEFKTFAVTHNVVVIVLSHLSKDKKQQKAGAKDDSWGTGRIPALENIYGSSSIEAWADLVISLARNYLSEDAFERTVTHVTLLKNRLPGERSSRRLYLQYVSDIGRLIPLPNADYEAYFDDEGDKK